MNHLTISIGARTCTSGSGPCGRSSRTSRARNVKLRSRAIALDWRDDPIIVIDNDQGESGASAAWREGFQRLVTDVGIGHGGICYGLEVPRLARNNERSRAPCPQSKVARRNRQQGAPGEYRCPLPTGLVYDEAGDVVLDPDAQVREAIAYFFETFSRVGSASQTVKMFRIEGLVFPSRLRVDDGTVFRSLTASTAMRMLHNPTIRGRLFKQRLQRHRSP
jgi:DNA invertase Pin-like site-specific DNA recombinase